MPPKKMGRPPSDNPKDKTLRIRVDDATLKKLDDCSQKLETSKSDVVRKGIELVHDSLDKK